MANTFKLETKKDIGTADSAVYTCPGGTATTIIGLNLANKTSSAITADVTLLNNGGDSCFLVKDAPIPIGSSLVAVGGDLARQPAGVLMQRGAVPVQLRPGGRDVYPAAGHQR